MPDEPTATRARVLSLHARAQLWHGHDEDAAQQAMEALGLAQKLDLPSLVADVTTTLAGIDDRAGDAETAQRVLHRGDRAGPPRRRRARRAAQPLPPRQPAPRARRPGRGPGRLPRRATSWPATSAGPWAPYGFEARLMEALVAYETGDWDDALELTDGRRPVPAAARRGDAARHPGAWSCVGRGDPASRPAARPAAPAVAARRPGRHQRGRRRDRLVRRRRRDVPGDAGVVRPGGRGRRRAPGPRRSRPGSG